MKAIAVAEDNSMDRMIFEKVALKVLPGIVMRFFENGRELLDHLKDCPNDLLADVIFLDLNMPLMSGNEFLKEFDKLYQKDERYRVVNVIITTSSENAEDRALQNQYECVRKYLVKPITREKLHQAMIDVFGDAFENL